MARHQHKKIEIWSAQTQYLLNMLLRVLFPNATRRLKNKIWRVTVCDCKTELDELRNITKQNFYRTSISLLLKIREKFSIMNLLRIFKTTVKIQCISRSFFSFEFV